MIKLIVVLLLLIAVTTVFAAPETPPGDPPKAAATEPAPGTPAAPPPQPYKTFTDFEGRPAFIVDTKTGEFDHLQSAKTTAKILWAMLAQTENKCNAIANELQAEIGNLKNPKATKKADKKKAEGKL